jgi:hypothetical protein
MIEAKGKYRNGVITLIDKFEHKDSDVIITFPDENEQKSEKDRKGLDFDSFSFIKARELLKNEDISFSDEIINERRISL